MAIEEILIIKKTNELKRQWVWIQVSLPPFFPPSLPFFYQIGFSFSNY